MGKDSITIIGMISNPDDLRGTDDNILVAIISILIHEDQANFYASYTTAIDALRMGGLDKERATGIANKAVAEIEKKIAELKENDKDVQKETQEREDRVRKARAKLGIKE